MTRQYTTSKLSNKIKTDYYICITNCIKLYCAKLHFIIKIVKGNTKFHTFSGLKCSKAKPFHLIPQPNTPV